MNIDDLWKVVEKDSTDWLGYLVLADALEESGQDRMATTCRWLATNRKRPLHMGNAGFTWMISEHKEVFPSCLPTDVLRLLATADNAPRILYYKSFRKAVEVMEVVCDIQHRV